MFMSASRENQKKKFEENLSPTIDSLYNMALNLTRYDRDAAADLVQEACLRAYRGFRRFEEGTNFKAWMMTILRNIYINQYRKSRREPAEVEFRENEAGDFTEPPDVTGGGNFSEEVEDSIKKLPEEMRIAVILFYAEGFTYKEISEITGAPVGTVMSRLYNARQILKKKLSGSAPGKGA